MKLHSARLGGGWLAVPDHARLALGGFLVVPMNALLPESRTTTSWERAAQSQLQNFNEPSLHAIAGSDSQSMHWHGPVRLCAISASASWCRIHVDHASVAQNNLRQS